MLGALKIGMVNEKAVKSMTIVEAIPVCLKLQKVLLSSCFGIRMQTNGIPSKDLLSVFNAWISSRRPQKSLAWEYCGFNGPKQKLNPET